VLTDFAIAAVVIIVTTCLWWDERRPPVNPHDVLDRMAQRAAAGHRDDPPPSHAWPPGTLHVPSGPQPCGCVVVSTPDGVQLITCPAHDPQFVSEWEQRLSQ
jgi:hypothetical protein